jgi:hypothetical protein
MGQLSEKDPSTDRFRALVEDLPVQGLPAGLETGTAWISKTVGDA